MEKTHSDSPRRKRHSSEGDNRGHNESEAIEDYPQDMPFPSCLILGWVKDKPYHALVSLDENSGIGYIITAYEPSTEKFGPDFRARR
jgi:hypothetical protein